MPPPSETYLIGHGVQRQRQEGERQRQREGYGGVQKEILHVVGCWFYTVELVTPTIPGIKDVVPSVSHGSTANMMKSFKW